MSNGISAMFDRLAADGSIGARKAAENTFECNPMSTQVGGDHYSKLKIQPSEYIEANGLSFLEGCIVKRATRWKSKDGIKDLEKIKHECDILIDLRKRGVI